MIMTGGITQQLFRGWKRGHKSISHRLWHNAELRELRGISCAHRGSCWAKLILVKEKKEKNWHYRGIERKTEGERGSQLWGFKRREITRNRVGGTKVKTDYWRERKKDGDKEVQRGRVAAGRFWSMLLWYWLSNWWGEKLTCHWEAGNHMNQSRTWWKPFKRSDTNICKQTLDPNVKCKNVKTKQNKTTDQTFQWGTKCYLDHFQILLENIR